KSGGSSSSAGMVKDERIGPDHKRSRFVLIKPKKLSLDTGSNSHERRNRSGIYRCYSVAFECERIGGRRAALCDVAECSYATRPGCSSVHVSMSASGMGCVDNGILTRAKIDRVRI